MLIEKKIVLTLFWVIFAYGCSPKLINIPVKLDESKAKTLLMDGGNTINGQVRNLVKDGIMVSCANESVSLVPATDYAREWVRYYYETDSGKYGTDRSAYRLNDKEKPVRFENADRFYHLTKTTKCDDDGEFSFEKVHDGDFYVVTKVRWLGQDHEYYDFMWGTSKAQEQDGSLMAKVMLRGGTTKNVSWPLGAAEILDGEALGASR